MKKILLICSVCTLLVAVGCMTSQDQLATIEHHIIAAENRLSEIESKLEAEQASGEESEKSLRDRFADMRVELTGVQSDLQNLTGRLDQLEHRLGQYMSERDKKYDRTNQDIRLNNERIIRLEEYLNLEPAEMKKNAEVPKPENDASMAELSEEQLYFAAKKAFDQNDLETAREGFEKLIKRYPKSQNADNAQFWIGEIYYREKWYEKAILEYQKVIENYAKGNKVQAALLKQGLSFLNLGDKANARLILNELTDKYPKSSEAEIARAKLKDL
ncbi:MAG: tol-pal system protein YbgF [Desulfobacterales bacterium]